MDGAGGSEALVSLVVIFAVANGGKGERGGEVRQVGKWLELVLL